MTSETRSAGAAAAPAATPVAVLATAAIVASILLTITIGLLGPSALVPALTGAAWHPPFSLSAAPDPHLVVAMAAAALVLGAAGLLAGLSVLPSRAGVARPLVARRLVALGCVAAGVLAFLPPSGSGDHLNYAAYGRMLTLGLSPYSHGATDLPGDPIADAVEEPWREEPSVYGPVATFVQALASWVGGDSLRLTIFVLALVNAAAFVATGLLIDRFTRHDPARRVRAALLWTANPLLLYQLVAGMHVDTLAIACVVAALLASGLPSKGGALATGALLGLGVAAKVNVGLVALGPAWEMRRRPGRLALVAGIALAVVIAGYVLVGAEAVGPVTRTSKSISHASPWKLVQGWLQEIVGTGSAYRSEIQIGSLLLLALIAWSLFRATRAARGPAGESAAVVALVLVVAYLFASPYVLPWYDGLAFGVLALVAASTLDRFLVAHLLVLSLAYLPARVYVLPDDLEWLRSVVRGQVTPWALLALTAALLWWARRAARPLHTPRA
ncbi:polyprenol phosphomannose-dependent alpha 1,6 mannosyltransferase MptB [Nonomuraea sp. NPDC023979]|uniref:polyprenol phosphomannose-dependent alpha 1,6 mannosyltransferase MptB n=1 Tax=Nonomuraea sp. NPDC023979 TaxID=3154796 RepID=UPI0033D9383E